MDKLSIGVLGFISGALISTVVTYLYCKKIAEREVREIITEMRDQFLEDGVPIEEANKATKVVPSIAAKKGPIENYVDYYKQPEELNKKRFGEYIDSMGAETYEKVVDRLDDEPLEPFIISEAAYESEFVDYDKQILYYYVEDDVLMFDDETVIDEINDVVGDVLSALPQHTDTVHVRNHGLSEDYEINLVAGAYAELILGIPLERG
jgi:hypothetical protein